MPEFSTAWVLPLVYSTGLLALLLVRQKHWAIACGTALAGLAATVAVILAALLAWLQSGLPATDTLGLVMALLAALLGWVIINYSHRYLDGESGQERFVRAMVFTLACVGILVASRHLLVIVLAWSATSFGLHYLLTHYRERKAAQIVAHKKFIANRLADISLAIALVLTYQATGSLALDQVSAALNGFTTLPWELHTAAALFALAAILKSAQLPLHGWLIQVMEAPTPVSALLHAGVVNIGGFVLIRLAELVAMAPMTQALLVITGSMTAVLAGLVMMTRISIKVRLAWSTCAQMGFMLMEVGLGLYELALLHLVAHSLYKAHAFLAAGETVAETRQGDFWVGQPTDNALGRDLASFVLSAAVVALSVTAWGNALPGLALPWVASLIVVLGLAPLLWFEQGFSAALLARGLLRVLALTQLYLAWHVLFAGLAPAAAAVHPGLVAWTVASFVLLYGLQITLRRHPQGRLASALYPWAYCGFYLDESFTRLTFRWWPVRLNAEQAQTLAIKQPSLRGESS